jgi:hypothetical protein
VGKPTQEKVACEPVRRGGLCIGRREGGGYDRWLPGRAELSTITTVFAYAWEGPAPGFKRHVEGCAVPGSCNMAALEKYDTLLVNISAADTSSEMPVAP